MCEKDFFFLQASINPLGSHNYVLNYVLLIGDSGYALRPWMTTPVVSDVENAAVERYNSRQKSTRALIERCNGLLKMRFRCLLKHIISQTCVQRLSMHAQYYIICVFKITSLYLTNKKTKS